MAISQRIFAAAISVIPSGYAVAIDLHVIYDSGSTQSLAPFLDVLAAPDQAAEDTAPVAPSLGAADLANLLPIRSPTLSPGVVERQAIQRPYAAPMFLVGSDRSSRHWLVKHRDRLIALGAIGLLVEVPDLATLRIMVDLADGLTLMPASATDLAGALGITHYPVLVTADGIEQ